MPSEHFSNEIETSQNARTQFEAARDGLDAQAYTERQARIAADTTNATAIASETTRATEAEEALASGLATEQSRAQGVEDDLADSIAVITGVQEDTIADLAGLTSTVDGVQTRIGTSLEVGGALKANTVGASQITDSTVGNSELASDVKVGSLAAFPTTAKGSVQASVSEIHTRLAGVTNSDGTLKDGAVSTGTKIASSVMTQASLVFDPHNAYLTPGTNWKSRTRWTNSSNLSIVTPDAANPFGGKTLHMGTATANAGKRIWLDEAGIKVGDVLQFTAQISAASGGGVLACRFYTAADAALLTQKSSSTVTFNGTVQSASVVADAVPSTAAYVYVYIARTSGSAGIDIYEMVGTKGTFITAVPAPALPMPITGEMITDGAIVAANIATGLLSQDNLIPDPFNQYTTPNVDWGSRARWLQGSNMSLVAAASPNPYSSPALRIGTAASFGGKYVWLDEAGIKVGDTISFKVEYSAAAGSGNLTYRFFTAGGTGIASQVSTSPNAAFDGSLQTFSVSGVVVPATAAYIGLYVVRASGTSNIDIYAIWLGKGLYLPSFPGPSATPSWLPARVTALEAGTSLPSFLTTDDVYGRFYLRDWNAAIARIKRGVSGAQARIALIGDSWIQNGYIWNPLVDGLQDLYGAAGVGYVGIGNNHGAPTYTGTTYARIGTWTDTDQLATSKGVDLADGTTVDTSAVVTVVSVATDFVIQYLKQSGGGDFRYKIDAGGWTTVSTANASDLHATVPITGLSNASHTLTIEITVAGSSGVTLLGAAPVISGINGVIVDRIGNGGATAAQYAAVNATIWQAGLAALAPNLAIVLLGTNDDSTDVNPATFGTNLTTLVTRIRAAVPLCDVLLLTPAANGLSVGTYSMSQYVTQIRAVAVAQNCMCLDMYLNMASYTDSDSRSLMAGTSHLNANGGQVYADRMLRELVS